MTARLSLFQSDSAVRELMLDEAASYVIGRSPDCDICVDDAELSRRHARLSAAGADLWSIADLDSKNGVFVSGTAVRTAPLHDGAWIGLGGLAVRFEILDCDQVVRESSRQTALRRLTQQGRVLLDEAGDVATILRQLLATVQKISATERGFAMLTRPDGDLEVACTIGVPETSASDAVFRGSRGAVRQALSQRESVVTCNARVHEALANRKSIIAAQTGALVCLPLVVLEKVVGVIYADTSEPGKLFTELDLELLNELSHHAAVAVAATQLGVQLDAIDDQIGKQASTVSALATMRHRIPDVDRPVADGRVVPMTGLCWSRIEPQS